MIRKQILTGIAVLAAFTTSFHSTAQSGKMFDGINSELTRPGNFIYYGKYPHVTEIKRNQQNEVDLSGDGSVKIIQRESAPTPVLWQVMGKEANASTLMSWYIVDALIYGSTGQTWATSQLRNWLNDPAPTGFAANFDALEKSLVVVNTVNAPGFSVDQDLHSSFPGASSPNSNDKFYLSWGTPYLEQATSYSQNNVFWTLGHGVSAPPAPQTDSMLPPLKQTAALKGNPNNAVHYWLRNLRGPANDYGMRVKPNGNIDVYGTGVAMGVRPMFRLDTANVIFAAELIEQSDLTRLDQEVADNVNYRDGVALGIEAGGDPRVMKLTLNDGNSAIQVASLPYDYDETLADGGTVGLKSGDTLRLGGRSAITYAGYNDMAYKLVNGTNGAREIQRRGFTSLAGGLNDSLVAIVARNIYTETIPAASSGTQPNPEKDILRGNFDAYVWMQKHNANVSHVGSTPMHFNLHVWDDNTAPELLQVGKAIRRPSAVCDGDTAIVTFRIRENIGGKYYYMIDPSPAPTLVTDFVNPNPLNPLRFDLRRPFAPNSPLIRDTIVGFTDNNDHVIYILAKDSVRNVSNILRIVIPAYVPNVKPDSIPLTVYLRPGQTQIVQIDEFAYDPDVAHYGDELHITSIDTPSDVNIATAVIETLDSISLRITGVDAGDTAVYVTVKDYDGDSTKCRIGIVVRYAPPDPHIDYVEETLVNLEDGALYLINDSINEIYSGSIPIRDEWLGTTISIVEMAPNGIPRTDAAQFFIPQRPVAPVVKTYNETFFDFGDGIIILVNDSMQYRADTASVWTNVRANKTEIIDLFPGIYLVRYKAIADKQFASLPATAKIGNGVAPPHVSREIILPTVGGVTTIPVAGSHRIESHTSFTFTAVFGGEQLKVKTNRRTLDGEQEELTGVPNADGGFDYLIRRITTTPLVVTIGPETVGNEITGGATSAVWAFRNAVYIRTQSAETARIYTLSGTLVEQAKLAENGEVAITLPPGAYIVALSDGVRAKVAVGL